ncbi:ABC transporter permease [Propionivibrio sp.]|uniref:ABC transporter permease n=1 Tax=Propionivibrio sp. TaxID=2212460 RepID=UPI0039E6DA78
MSLRDSVLSRAFLSASRLPWPDAGALRRKASAAVLAMVVPALLLYLWQLASLHAWVPAMILPEPRLVLDSLSDLWRSGELAAHLGISLSRLVLGFLVGALAGLFLGFAMGLSRVVEAYVYPTFKALSQVPALGWIPLAIMLAGIDEAMKVIVVAKAAWVPVAINTQQAIRNIPEEFLEVGRIYRFNLAQRLTRIVVPGALPGIFNGIRYGLTHAWLALVTVELLASSEGIGFLVIWGRQLAQLDIVLAVIVVIGLIGSSIDQALQWVELHFLAWRRTAF